MNRNDYQKLSNTIVATEIQTEKVTRLIVELDTFYFQLTNYLIELKKMRDGE